MSVPAPAIVRPDPEDPPSDGVDPEVRDWIRGRLRWEERLDQLRTGDPPPASTSADG